MNEKTIIKGCSEEMLKKLLKRHDRYVPLAWRGLDMKRLLILLKEEIEELEISIAKNNKKMMSDGGVDIANYGMFIWDIMRKK